MDAFKAQQGIRNNASELSDYLSDLKSWGNDMNQKEQTVKQKKKGKNKKKDSLPPIRNQAKQTAKLKENEEIALEFKSEGNKYFKAANYLLAIESYSKAIEATPQNAVLYSNRAIAQLKNKDFESAESDCTKCIELDSSQIKAYFRRGLARKSLKKYNKSLQDFNSALKLNPKNKAAKKEKIEMKNKLQAMYKKSQQFGKIVQKKESDNKMRRIVIEECDESDSEPAADSSAEEDEKNDVKNNEIEVKETEKEEKKEKELIEIQEFETETFRMDRVPTSFIEFEKMWNGAKINKNRALILLALKNKKIERIIKNMMDDTLFSEMINTIHYIAMHVNICDALLALKQLTRLDRFDMIVMFINETDQNLLNEIKQRCEQQKLNVSVFSKFEL